MKTYMLYLGQNLLVIQVLLEVETSYLFLTSWLFIFSLSVYKSVYIYFR
jgi:hypothetical protein